MKQNNSFKYILATCIIVFGILYFLVGIGALAINLLFHGWWTLFIIIPSIGSITSGRNIIGGVLGLAIGVLLLLCAQGILNWDIIGKIFISICLIAIGAKILLNGARSNPEDNNSSFGDIKIDANTEMQNAEMQFGSKTINFQGKEFKGIKLKLSFGKMVLDLRNAYINRDCTIDCNCNFGCIEILLPKNVVLENRASTNFGAIDNKFTSFGYEDKYRVQLSGNANFGAIVIK